jgi:hypothetical protein
LNVEAGDLARLNAERVLDHLVLGPVRLILQWLAVEGTEGAAAAVPAWRATHVDPVRALRNEQGGTGINRARRSA